MTDKRRNNERRIGEIKAALRAGGLPLARQTALEDELLAVIRRDAADELAERSDDAEARRILEAIELEGERLDEAKLARARAAGPGVRVTNNGRGGPGRFPKNWHGHAAI